MSDVILLGILNMPLDYPLNQLTHIQLVSTCRQAAVRIESDKKSLQAIWNIIGECMTGITDAEKLSQIEKILLDRETA